MKAYDVRATHARTLVFSVLYECGRALVVEEVSGQLVLLGEGIGRTTVYRTLVEFEKAGIVRSRWIYGRSGRRMAFYLCV